VKQQQALLSKVSELRHMRAEKRLVISGDSCFTLDYGASGNYFLTIKTVPENSVHAIL
jgi:hypothetical protein